jgi:hypothetical protein
MREDLQRIEQGSNLCVVTFREKCPLTLPDVPFVLNLDCQNLTAGVFHTASKWTDLTCEGMFCEEA